MSQKSKHASKYLHKGNPDPKAVERHFIVRAVVVIVLLHGVALGFMGIAYLIDQNSRYDARREQDRIARLQMRIEPVAEVITDMAALEAVPAAKAAAAAARKAMSGDEVVAQVCAACHDSGLAGAPRSDDAAAWQARLRAAGGMDALVQSAIRGKNAMPPRGGRADLSDREIEAAVERMAPGA